MEEFIEIVTKFWAQIVVLLSVIFGGIGFLLQLYFNWTVKKKEITFSKVRETKIKELREFYSSYINLELHLKSLHFASGQNKKEYETEIRAKMPEIWKKFYLDFTFLRIFLNSDELVHFEELNIELENIQKKIDFYQIDKEFETYDRELILELRHIRDEIFPNRIPTLIKRIELNLRNDFEIK
jgi:hypothetical protein